MSFLDRIHSTFHSVENFLEIHSVPEISPAPNVLRSAYEQVSQGANHALRSLSRGMENLFDDYRYFYSGRWVEGATTAERIVGRTLEYTTYAGAAALTGLGVYALAGGAALTATAKAGLATATLLGLAHCGSPEGSSRLRRDIHDTFTPPPTKDLICGGRRTEIQERDPLREVREASADAGVSSATERVMAELQRQYPGIRSLPRVDVTFRGNVIYNDSRGNPVREIETRDVVSFVRIDRRLYVLTANRLSDAYAPATLLIYDVTTNPPSPVLTTDIARDSSGSASNALVFGNMYHPVAMAPSIGNSELSILFANGIVSTVSPFSNEILEGDWCSTYEARRDAGVDASRD